MEITARFNRAVADNSTFRSFEWMPVAPIIGSATGPLVGLTFSVKANVSVANAPVSCGFKKPLIESAVKNATIVEKLLDSGATLFGVSRMDEGGIATPSKNDEFSKVINPLDPNRRPLGSSSGAAVSVASGAVDFAIGSDHGGSVRAPAAACGIFSYRAAPGIFPVDGVILLDNWLESLGILSGSIEVLERVLSQFIAPQNGTKRPSVMVGDVGTLLDVNYRAWWSEITGKPPIADLSSGYLASEYLLDPTQIRKRVLANCFLKFRKQYEISEADVTSLELIALARIGDTGESVLSELEKKRSLLKGSVGSSIIILPTLSAAVPSWNDGNNQVAQCLKFLPWVNFGGFAAVTLPIRTRKLTEYPSVQLVGDTDLSWDMVQICKSLLV